MQTTSETWKSLWASGNAWLETKAVIAGVEYTDISAPAINRAAMQGGLDVGNAVSASLSLAVRTTDDIPKSAPVEILMRLTDGTTNSEWLPAGAFYISKRARDPVAGVQSFECYDALLKANAALDEVPWTTEAGEQITTDDDEPIMFDAFYPRDMASLAMDIAIMLGVELDARTVINTGAEYVVSNPAAGATIRDLLGTVAAAHGGNWIITPEGKLRLVPVISVSGAAAATEDVADIVGTVGSIYVGDSAIISGVRYTAGEAEPVLIGDETGVIIDVSLPYALAHNLAQALIGTAYQPYTMSGAIYDPAAELGDYVRSGSDVASVLYSEAALLGPAFRGDIAAPEPSEIADEFPYIGASAKALTEAKAYAVEKATEATEQLSESLTQEEIFNRLTDNGVEQGLILYNGKLYLNAEYIQAGTISANLLLAALLTVGGQADGSIRILDANGNVIGTWDKNGITATKGNILLDYNSVLQIGFNSDNTQYARFNRDGMSFRLNGNTFLGTGSFATSPSSPIPSTLIGRLFTYVDSEDNTLRLNAEFFPSGIECGLLEKNSSNVWVRKKYLYYDTDSFQVYDNTDENYSDFRVFFKTTPGGLNSLQYNGDYARFNSEVVINGDFTVYGNCNITSGASGTFTTANGTTVTVTNGIITSIT